MSSVTVDAAVWQEMLRRMSLPQWRFFLAALAQVVNAREGTVTLQIKRGVVRRVTPAPSLDLPDPDEV